MFTWTPDFATPELTEKWAQVDPSVQELALMYATSSLQMLTLNRVGTPPITLRPCPVEKPCGHDWDAFRWEEYGYRYGWWLNTCGCTTARWCAPLSEFEIPGPVGFIDSLKIDGAEVDLASGNWRMDDGTRLVWQGTGPSPLPSVQDFNKPDSAPGTWSITYSKSYPVGPDAQVAVGLLALEFAKAFKPKGACALPRGVTNLVRSGVSFTIEAGLFPNGLTGMDLVDAFILKWVPPGSPNRSAQVFSPRQVLRKHRVTKGVPMRGPGMTP